MRGSRSNDRRLPSPRRSPPLFVNISSRRISGFSSFGSLADLTWCNEADSGSIALRLAGSFHGASTPILLPSLSASLHAGCSVGMINTFQFIGLGWRCWRTGEARMRRIQGFSWRRVLSEVWHVRCSSWVSMGYLSSSRSEHETSHS